MMGADVGWSADQGVLRISLFTISRSVVSRTSTNGGKESKMDSVTERASANARRGRDEEKREVDYYVRAKTGPGRRDWTTIGVAFTRRNNEPGFTVKLNTLPIDKNWNGSLILVPPFVEEVDED
jgi:hypothetical protein